MASLTIPTPIPIPIPKPKAVTLLELCQNWQQVRQVHAHFVVSGLIHHPLNAGRLVHSYVTFSSLQHALSVFNTIPSPDIFTFNNIIRGFILSNDPFTSLLLCNNLLLLGLNPDSHTYTFVFKACSQLKSLSVGKQMHCHLIKSGIEPHTHIHTSLIHMYSSSGNLVSAERVLSQFPRENTHAMNAMISGYLTQGCVDKARETFDKVVAKDVASWSAMITGYVDNDMNTEALSLFREMMNCGVSMNESTLVSCLCASAKMGALDQGKWIHVYADRVLGKISINLGTALIGMYAKCGCIESSEQVFRNLADRDVVTWGAIISGFAVHGKPDKCFQLFDEMVSEGIRPNEVIFVAILSACSHSGRVDMGRRYFRRMVHEFGIVASIEHYGCMVDLLGRAGRLAEAEEFIDAMPMKANSIIWGSFLSACRSHNDAVRGSRAFRELKELEPMSGDRYKLAALMYGNAGKEEKARTLREFIDENNLKTTCGLSFIEIDGVVKEFVAGNVVDDDIYL